MQAGKLRQRVVIQEKHIAKNEFNEDVLTWLTFAERWAAVRPLVGREYLEGRQMENEISHRVQIRYLEGVVPEMRVLHQGRVLEIEAVMDVDERHEEMVLMCKEFVP